MSERIAVPRERVADFCRRHHVRRLALFGSVLRDDFGPDSDVDVLVEFQPGHVPGLAFFAMQDELAEILGRPIWRAFRKLRSVSCAWDNPFSYPKRSCGLTTSA